MSNRTGAGHALDDLSQLSTAQRRLTAVIFVAPLLVWTCSLPAGARFSPWTLLGVVLVTVFTVIHPDSLSGLFTVLLLGWYWLAQVPTHPADPISLWTLAAGLCLLAFHTATAARATAPGPTDLDQGFWRQWLRRVTIIATGTVCVWALTALINSHQHGQETLTLAAFAILAGGTAYSRSTLGAPQHR
jgi:hypothetical protein